MDLNNLDKSSWETFRFDQIAKKVSETVDPNSTDLDIYVGLEHLDAESIHIKRTGTPDQVSGGKLKCYPGDVIFGKRRAYQRKAAVVDFEGICSAHAFVLRAKPEVIDPKLFPFFLHSDQFMHRAVDISVGGLSPTINWGQLKEQEFLLPPKAEQARLAELLWAMDEVVEKNEISLISLRKFYLTEREFSILKNGKELVYNSRLKEEVNAEIQFIQLEGVLRDIRYGTSQKSNNNGSGVPVLGIPNVIQEKLSLEGANFVELMESEREKCTLENGDIVIVRTNGNPDYTGRSALYNIGEGHVFASYLIKITVNQNQISSEFLVRFLQTKTGRRYFRRHATSTAGNYNINTETIKGIVIPIISMDAQMEIVQRLKDIEENIQRLDNQLSNSKTLQKSLINQIF